MHDVQLRLTDTNSATDSDGIVWGIDATLFGIVLCGACLSIALWLALWDQTSLSTETTVVCGALPLAITVAYVLFKQSHPPGYDFDVIEYWLCGPSLGPAEWQPDSDDAHGSSTVGTHSPESAASVSVLHLEPPQPTCSQRHV